MPPRWPQARIIPFFRARATARIASYLQCRRPRGAITSCDNDGILFRDTSAERRSADGTFSPSWEVPWGPPSPPKEVLKFRGRYIFTVYEGTGHCKNERFELAATSVATSYFQNFFWGPRRAPGDPPGRGKRSVFAPSFGAPVAEQYPFMFAV